jgi:hypothetical protein
VSDSQWTEEQLRDLAIAMPDQVRIDEAGRIVPLIDKAEARHILDRYPTCFGLNKDPAPAAGRLSEEDAVLAAKYPSMFGPKK